MKKIFSLKNIQKEISFWETKVSEKEKKVSDLSIQIQNLKISFFIFLIFIWYLNRLLSKLPRIGNIENLTFLYAFLFGMNP